MMRVSAAIIRNDKGEILICQRGAGGQCAYLREFPGGKQELGETSEECLIRECKEELEIDIAILELFAETTYIYPEQEIAFSFFKAKIVNGKLKIDVHNAMEWVVQEDLFMYKFCPADIAVVERLVKKGNENPSCGKEF